MIRWARLLSDKWHGKLRGTRTCWRCGGRRPIVPVDELVFVLEEKLFQAYRYSLQTTAPWTTRLPSRCVAVARAHAAIWLQTPVTTVPELSNLRRARNKHISGVICACAVSVGQLGSNHNCRRPSPWSEKSDSRRFRQTDTSLRWCARGRRSPGWSREI